MFRSFEQKMKKKTEEIRVCALYYECMKSVKNQNRRTRAHSLAPYHLIREMRMFS